MRLMRFGFMGGGGFVFNDTVTADLTDYNLASRATSAGWDGVLALIASVTINAAARVTASPGRSAFEASGPFPIGSSLTLVLQSGARIYGRGGAGGAGGLGPGGAASSGGAGGAGLSVGLTTSVNNAGTIAGGGGGGGGGGAGTLITSLWGRGGGGGGGAQPMAQATPRKRPLAATSRLGRAAPRMKPRAAQAAVAQSKAERGVTVATWAPLAATARQAPAAAVPPAVQVVRPVPQSLGTASSPGRPPAPASAQSRKDTPCKSN